jgi:hypothetical protein
VPATINDDPELKHDWHWSGKHGGSHCVSGCLVEPINPTISTRDAGRPFYLFESSVLMALGLTILECICSEDGHLLLVIHRSDFFPYREETSQYHSNKLY